MRTRQTLRQAPMILLRCPREMIGQLHSHGFHPGYWRDRETGLDMGLKKIFEREQSREERIVRAAEVVRLAADGKRSAMASL